MTAPIQHRYFFISPGAPTWRMAIIPAIHTSNAPASVSAQNQGASLAMQHYPFETPLPTDVMC